MNQLLINVFPLALAAAVSPLLVVTVLYYLGGTRPLLRAISYVTGVTFVCIAIAVVFITGFLRIQPPRSGGKPGLALTATYLVVGVLLLLMAAASWIRKPAPAGPPRIDTSNRAADVGRAFRNGAALEMVNASSLPIFADALNTIGLAAVGVAVKIWVTAIFIGLMLCEIYIPVVFYALAPRVFGPTLTAARTWLTGHLRGVTIGVGLAYGTYFLSKGFIALA